MVSSRGFLYSGDRVPDLARSPIGSIVLWFNPGQYFLGLPLHGMGQLRAATSRKYGGNIN
ncbi:MULTISPECIES: hypothetical protein [Cyanophyceae]|uniref:Uncharacterized protein n=1 Tax=Leptolyngbya subtilissima DQ-A4 TaxID=2933933 RepID=A0ABV0K8L4_9CYAN|nr:hypothetical protein [Nodosilinea sp. FACHB-141]MBD2110280.1 hypothetical protein [Nodosilinea sp. FACHB-141]